MLFSANAQFSVTLKTTQRFHFEHNITIGLQFSGHFKIEDYIDDYNQYRLYLDAEGVLRLICLHYPNATNASCFHCITILFHFEEPQEPELVFVFTREPEIKYDPLGFLEMRI